MKKSSILIAIRTLIILTLIVGAFIFAKKVCLTSYSFGRRVFTETAIEDPPGTDVIVQISGDMSSNDIADLLEEKGLIRDAQLFLIQLRLSAYHGRLKPGAYTLNTSMEPREIMAVLAAEETDTESTE